MISNLQVLACATTQHILSALETVYAQSICLPDGVEDAAFHLRLLL